MCTLKLIVIGGCILSGPCLAMADGEHIWNPRFVPDTYLYYKFRKEPLEQVVTKIAKRMGFSNVTFADEKLKETTYSGLMDGVPAWRALVEVLQKHQLEFDVQEYELHIQPCGDLPVHYRFSPGMCGRFSQQAVGAKRPDIPKYLPYDFRIFLEPRLTILFSDVTVSEQIDVQGNPSKSLKGVNHSPLLPQIDPQESIDPWPGIDAFKVQLQGEFIEDLKFVMVSLPDIGEPTRRVTADFIHCYDLTVLERDGFVDLDIVIAAPKTGGFSGDHDKRFLEQVTNGYQIFVRKGSFFADSVFGGSPAPPDIIYGEGGGDEPLVVTFRYKPETLREYGGLDELTITVAKPRGRSPIKATFEFTELLPNSPHSERQR